MKFFLRFFAIVAVIVGLIIGIYHILAAAPGASRRLESGLSATFTDKNRPAPAATPPPAATPVDYGAAAQQAAFRAGVQLVSFAPQGQQYLAEVKWTGSNAAKGGDFLDALTNMGRLRDFDQVGDVQISKDNRGANTYTAKFRLTMR
ncbi:MAG: hypothetical protein KF858_11020 [Candidatus Sumerlaeia bacterium]|nr:hypothetical protein [Candidatus Sumerlaeia bacterium]